MRQPPVVRLDSVAEVRLGRQRSPKDHVGPQMRPYVRAANVGWDGLLLDDVKFMNFTEDEMKVYGLQPGDVLLNEASGSAREVGKPAIWNGEIEGCAFQNTLLRVRPNGAEPRYLLHYFKQQASTGAVARQSRGVGIHHLGREALAAWPVPLPPPGEQRRIVALLDRADEVRACRRASLGMLTSLAESIFVELFGNAPSSMWPTRPLGELIEDAQLGLVRNSSELDKLHCHPYIRMNAIGRSGELDLSDVSCTFASPHELEIYSVRRGDLLFNTRNTRELVGKTAIYRRDGMALFNNNLLRLRFTTDVRPEYAVAAMRLPDVQRQLERRKAGTTSVFAIYSRDLQSVEVPLPPVELQATYEASVDRIRRQREASNRDAAHLDALLESLQHGAFSGAL